MSLDDPVSKYHREQDRDPQSGMLGGSIACGMQSRFPNGRVRVERREVRVQSRYAQDGENNELVAGLNVD